MYFSALILTLWASQSPLENPVTCKFSSSGKTRTAWCEVNHIIANDHAKYLDSISPVDNSDEFDSARNNLMDYYVSEKSPIELWIFDDAVNNPGFDEYKVVIGEVTMACEDDHGHKFNKEKHQVAEITLKKALTDFYKTFKYPKREGYLNESSGKIKVVDLLILSKNDRLPNNNYSQKSVSFSDALRKITYLKGHCGRRWPLFDLI